MHNKTSFTKAKLLWMLAVTLLNLRIYRRKKRSETERDIYKRLCRHRRQIRQMLGYRPRQSELDAALASH